MRKRWPLVEKKKIGRAVVLGLFFVLFLGAEFPGAGEENGTTVPPLELELESAEYRSLLSQQGNRAWLLSEGTALEHPLADLIRLGERNLELLAHLNRNRPENQKLALTSPALQPGYPMDAPKESSPRIVRAREQELRSSVPAELVSILWGAAPFPTSLLLTDEEYLLWARRVDGVYQGASRWILQEPYLEAYAQRQARDIRGYAFLMAESRRREILSNWATESEEQRARFRPWLIGLCLNSGSSASACGALLRSAEGENRVLAWAESLLPRAERIWKSYFELGGRRSDVRWDRRRPEWMILPFKDPADEAIRRFLVENIEEEFRLNGWALRLDFGGWSWNTAEVVFVPGATPHVNGLGGNRITMDANQSLTEYGTRWTIRHEFGHVLGLPDCYIEFYDSEREVMVSYQLDLSNLMCSRRGKFQALHFEELKKAYFR
jgi:hypothetical protein